MLTNKTIKQVTLDLPKHYYVIPNKKKHDVIKIISFVPLKNTKKELTTHFIDKGYNIVDGIKHSRVYEYQLKKGKKNIRIIVILSHDNKGGDFIGNVKYYIDKIPTIIQNLPLIFKGVRRNYPPQFREFKANYGNIRIDYMKVCKDPIQKVIDVVLNLISLGKYEENKQRLNYDDMFHLYLLMKTVDGRYIRLEKNQVLNVHFTDKINATTCQEVQIPSDKVVTLNSLLDTALNNLGESMFLYDGINNNCQYFIDNVLKYSNLLTTKLHDFVMQDTEEIIGTLQPHIKDIAKGVTNLAGLWDLVLHGEGFYKLFIKYKNKYSDFKNI